MDRTTAWLAGRGVARSCGFSWEVPEGLYEALDGGGLSRRAFESRIRSALAAAQAAHFAQGRIDAAPVERLLGRLERSGVPAWRHAFITTNWNTVLDRALAHRGKRVWHLNGSIEDAACPLYTEADAHDGAVYRNEGFRCLREAEVCVLAGLSFASRLDRGLMERLGAGTRTRPAGMAWVVVNDDPADLWRAARLLRGPVMQVCMPFERWVETQMPELQSLGVIA